MRGGVSFGGPYKGIRDQTVHRKLCNSAQFSVHVAFRSRFLMVIRAGEEDTISHLKKVFCPDFYVKTSFQLLEIL